MQRQTQPKIHHLLIRIHRLTILITAQPTTTIDSIKEQVLDALTAPVSQPDLDDVDVQSIGDFELCRVVKSGNMNTKPGGIRQYEVLEGTQKVKDVKVAGWEVVYVQLRNRGTGQLEPINATDPPTDDDEEPQLPPPPVDVKGKGKRKADEEDDLFDD